MLLVSYSYFLTVFLVFRGGGGGGGGVNLVFNKESVLVPPITILLLTTTWNTFNSQFYQQTDGVTMGGSASSTTAEIHMQAHESTAISTALLSPKV